MVCLFWCVVLLAGCTASVPLTHYYTFQPTQRARAEQTSPQFPYILGVETFEADSPYQQDRIVYRDSMYEVNFYEYRRWLRPPTELVAEAVQRHLEQAGLCERVHTFEMESYSDYTLRGKIELFDRWFDEDTTSHARVSILYQLFDSESRKILWMKRVETTAPITTLDMVDVVKGFETALQQNMQQVVAALDRTFHQQ